jgi:NADH:ubiquinone reductase (H+-translocating)
MADLKRVVVIGAGIAGLLIAQELKSRKDAVVTLVSDREHFLFLPRLTELFSETIPAKKALLPIKDVWKGEFILNKANLVNPQEKTVILNNGQSIKYDVLVIAIGSQVNFFNTPGSQYSYAFYNKEDADKLKEHMTNLLEGDEQAGTHTFAVVGGGPTGVEVANIVSRFAKKKRPASKVLVVEQGPTILKVLPEKAAKAAQDVLESEGIQIMTGVGVKNITPLSIEVQKADGSKETLPCYTTIWAAGSKPQQISLTGIELSPRGEIPVEKTLQAVADKNIFAVGDIAAAGVPKTAQAALQEGKLAAENIKRFLDNKPLEQFVYKDKGTLLALDEKTVGLVYGQVLRGFIPRQLRDKYYQFALQKYQ